MENLNQVKTQISAVIKGVGSYLPERIVSSEELEELAQYPKYGIKSGMVRMLTGVAQRHYAAPGEYCSDIATKAGLNALESAGITADELDAIIYCGVTHDFAEPATASVIVDKIKARNVFSFDIKNACNAFISGVDIADSFIKTGKAKNVLVTSGEALSRWIKFDYGDDIKELKKRTPVTFSLGDGGGAFVISAEKDTDRGIKKSLFHTYGELWNNNVMWGGGVVYPHDADKMFIPGTTKALVERTITDGQKMIKKTVKETGWPTDAPYFFVMTQAAQWVTDRLAKDLDIAEDKIIRVYQKYGNVGAANVPLAAYDAIQQSKINEGDNVVLYSAGVGLSLGCITIKW